MGAFVCLHYSQGLMINLFTRRRCVTNQQKGAHMLSRKDYQAAAQRIGCDTEAIMAIASVESNGGGFNKDGTVKTQFEPYVFYRRLKAKFGQARADLLQQQHPDIIWKKTGDYNSQAVELSQLDEAMLIDHDVAIESASYGAFQIMGYHWKALGLDSPQELRDRISSGEQGQLSILVLFVLADRRLVQALQDKDWQAVARIYNGPSYQKFDYDEKLEAAYKKAVVA